jgi:hypothetical protein
MSAPGTFVLIKPTGLAGVFGVRNVTEQSYLRTSVLVHLRRSTMIEPGSARLA